MKFWGTDQVVFDACILDASTIVEVGLKASHCEVVVTQMARMRSVAVGAPSLVEAALVLQRRFGYDPRPWLEGFVRNSLLEVIPFGYEHELGRRGLSAFRQRAASSASALTGN